MPKALVVDDSQTVRRVVERLLTSEGLDVSLVETGEEAVTWLAKERPDIVITDVNMPGVSGYDLCRFIKSNAVLADTPVLLIAGVVDEEVTQQAKACRADGVLKKPLKGASLQDRARELLAARYTHSAAAHEAAEGTEKRIKDLESQLLAEQNRVIQLEGQVLTLREKLATHLYTQLTEERRRAAQLEKELRSMRKAVG